MPSFDIVSELNWAEVDNALNQTQKELSQRYDFRGTEAVVEKIEGGIVVRATEEDRARAALDVLNEKLIRRKVSLKHFDAQDPEPGPKGSSKIVVKVQEGIEHEKARELVQMVKDRKLKVQAAVHEATVRVTGKKRDDLQAVIQMLRGADVGIELQFKNFRD
jgi:uncharacterized protein YajQ (UPF0234 family)